ncbi:MAG: electron transfer flavoprotein subunit alpha/FixB family protein [Gemmatimonadetes bacterium]|nr:electron transfer flavoprotein subunit alpha/FixB family protein [Gemmatimonadota bacterium]
MGDILAILEQRDGTLRGVSAELVSAAADIAGGGQVHALVLGGPGLADGVAAAAGHGAAKIRVAEHEALGSYVPELHAAVVAEAVKEGGYDAVLFAATSQGKDLAPRVAALLDVPLASDATELTGIDGRITVTRPIYAGKAFARLTLDAKPALISLRPNAFPVREVEAAGEVETFQPSVDAGALKARVVGFEETASGSTDVAEASVVVSGGRGMRDPEHWHLLEELRDALGSGSALGASRAVVDAGWRPHAEQVGQTGKTVAPKLYFAIGISGAIQHLAGMRTAGTIVAINKDADAPIFAVADYGIVGDLFEVVPRLAEEIRTLKQGG